VAGSTTGLPVLNYASDPTAGTGTRTDTLVYRITDADGSPPDTATVTITITDEVPDARNDPSGTTPIIVEDNVSTIIPVVANDTKRSNLPLTIAITQQPTRGTVRVNAIAPPGIPNVSYRSNPGASGSDTFRYRLTDGDGDTDEAVVTLTIRETQPVAANDPNQNGDARVPVAIDVLQNDSGYTADTPIRLEITRPAAHGTTELVTVVAGAGTRPGIAYASEAGYAGPDSFDYRIVAADGDVSNDATVTLSVADQTPVAVDDVAGLTPALLPLNSGLVIEGMDIGFDVLRNDTGRANRRETLTITQPPAHGTAEVDDDPDSPRARIVYRSDTGYTGPDEFRYSVTDADGDSTPSNEATVSFDVVSIVTATNDGDPLPLPTNRDVALTVRVLDNDGGLAYGPIQVTVDDAENGTATVNADNTVTFRPEAGFTGRWNSPGCPANTCPASGGGFFTYTVKDSLNQTAQGVAFIDVFPQEVNDQGGSSALDEVVLALLIAGAWIRRARRRFAAS
jgi:hypothetical protein